MEPLRPGDPRQVGPYRLEGRLGGGGMGQVYLGRSRGGWPFAVKVVRPEWADNAEFRRRFAIEVQAARKVGGVYTAPVVDADTDAEPPWLATAYISGPSLQKEVAEHGSLSAAALARLGAGLAEGLAAVHKAGLIHRDLKPGNVLLAADGPRIIDFGIARALDATSHTATGQPIGTVPYMSPEQVRDGGNVDQRTDVFSLGAVLVFAATGRPPFGNESRESIMYRILHEDPDLGDLPEPLTALVTACLAKDPGDRPTPDQVIDRLAAPDEPTASPGDATTMAVRQSDDDAGVVITQSRDNQFAATTGTASSPPDQNPAEQDEEAVPAGQGKLIVANFSPSAVDVMVGRIEMGTIDAYGQLTSYVAPGYRTVRVRKNGQLIWRALWSDAMKGDATMGDAMKGRLIPWTLWSGEIYSDTTIRLVHNESPCISDADKVSFSRITVPGMYPIFGALGCSILILVFTFLVKLSPHDWATEHHDVMASFAGVLLALGICLTWFTRHRLVVSNSDLRYVGDRGYEAKEWANLDQVGISGDGPSAELVFRLREESPGGADEMVRWPLARLAEKYNIEEIRRAVRFFSDDLYIDGFP